MPRTTSFGPKTLTVWFRAALTAMLILLTTTSGYAFSAVIQQIQEHLGTLGYDAGPADGLEGNRTRAAVEGFKADQGLPADIGESQLLAELARLAQAETGPDPETAKAIQRDLIELGYVPGPVTGNWDSASREALWLFLGVENGRGLLDNDGRTAAERHVDILAFIEKFKARQQGDGTNELFVPVGGVNPTNFSPNGRFLIAVSDGILLVWDVTSGQQIHAIRMPAVSEAGDEDNWEFTADGKGIVIGKHAFQVIDLESGRATKTFWVRPTEGGGYPTIFEFAARPGTSELVVAESEDVTLYDTATGRYTTTLHTYGLVKFTQGNTIWTTRYATTNSVAVSQDGLLAASAGTEFGIRIYDLNARQVLFTASGAAGIKYTDLVFSPDGRFVYARPEYLGDSPSETPLFRLELATQRITSIRFESVYDIMQIGNEIHIDGDPTGDGYGVYQMLADGSYFEVEAGPLVSPDGRYEVQASAVDAEGNELANSLQIRDLEEGDSTYFAARSADTANYLSGTAVFNTSSGLRTVRTLDVASGTLETGVVLSQIGEGYESSGYSRYTAETGHIVLLGAGANGSSGSFDSPSEFYSDFRVYDASTGSEICWSDQRASWRQRDTLDFQDKSPGRLNGYGNYAWSDTLQQGFIWTNEGIAVVDTDCTTVAVHDVGKASNYTWRVSEEFRRELPTFSPRYSEGATINAAGDALLAWRPEPAVQKLDPATGEQILTYSTAMDIQPSGLSDQNYKWLSTDTQHTLVNDVIAIPGTSKFLVQLNGTYGSGDFNNVGVIQVFDEAEPHWETAFLVSNFGRWAVSKGGRFLALGNDVSLRTVDPGTGRLIANMQSDVPTEWIGFSDDGTKLLADGIDGYRRIFDAATGELLASTLVFTDGEWLTLTPEGFFVSSEGGADDLRMRLTNTELAPIGNAFNALYRPDLVAAKLAGDADGLVADAASRLDLLTVIQSGVAPNVVIASPASGQSLDTETVEVATAITDQGGGIGKVEWRINGVTLGVETRGFDRLLADAEAAANPAAEPVMFKRSLSLEPGENLIEVIAYNEQGLIASDPATVIVNWDGETSLLPPRLFVLSVGVNDYYDSRLQLAYAASDATAIGRAFELAGKNFYERVEVTTVLDADVTLENLGKVFSELAGRVRPHDVFVLFMAGHGKTEDGKYYFLPADFRYRDDASIVEDGIGQEHFQEWLAGIPARKSLLLYDTCESGSLTAPANAATSRGLEEVAALARMTRAMGRTVLSASTDTAPALEGYNNHGVFTYALLMALGEGDLDADGAVSVTELASVVDREVPELSFDAFRFRQVPQMSIQGSDFPLVLKTAVLSEVPVAPAPATPAAPVTEEAPAPSADASRYVAIAELTVREAPSEDAAVSAMFHPGTVLEVIGEEGEWRWVARNGVPVGFVTSDGLAQLE